MIRKVKVKIIKVKIIKVKIREIKRRLKTDVLSLLYKAADGS